MTNKKKCDGHTPTKVLELGGGVWAGSKYECRAKATNPANFDAVVNCTGTAIFSNYNHKIPFEWGKEFEKPVTNEIILDWFNNQPVYIHPNFWLELRKFILDKNLRVLVCCEGGHGRTGTALVSLMLAGGKWETWPAINEIRKIYCSEAVETKVQVEYLQDLEKYFKGEK